MPSMQSETSRRHAMAEIVADAYAPAHVDAEVLSALGRLQRARKIEADSVETMLHHLADAPIQRHPVTSVGRLRG